MNTLNQLAEKFAAALSSARKHAFDATVPSDEADTFHVIGAGRTITTIYEQVRNAAEYTDEHLLLQRAIRRFYRRLFLTSDKESLKRSGEELVTELTLAGYLANDSVSLHRIKLLTDKTLDYHTAYKKINTKDARQQQEWTVDVLAIEAESLLRSHALREAFEQFAFDHFVQSIDKTRLYSGTPSQEHELLLYVAVHRALLKSDDATIRWSLLRRFGQEPTSQAAYRQTNETIDKLLRNKDGERLRRIVNREGAVFRVLWKLVNEHDNAHEVLANPHKFLALFETQVNLEYESAAKRINRGITRSIIFLIITKFLIGIAIEVPYDYAVHGEILWLALLVNLLAPPLYMMTLRLTLRLPGAVNTRALVAQADQLLYSDKPAEYKVARQGQQYGAAFNVAYGLLFVLIFGLVSWGLVSIGFSLVHLAIFFVFFSTASFLGFRLSRIIRELETVDNGQDGIAMVRDFIYLPFVVVGRKLSEGYARFNIIAMLLDMLIELPLKTVLQLTRRWGAFINSKKDEL